MLKESDDPDVKRYLRDKVRQAKWLVDSVGKRTSAMLACVTYITDIQKEFFLSRYGSLRPLSMAQVAQALGVHESTVSRIVKDKYLQCDRGVFPLSFFFRRKIRSVLDEQNQVVSDGAKKVIRESVDQEDKKRPLSDQELCERLRQNGYVLSRRTVAKYREEMQIPSMFGRKQS